MLRVVAASLLVWVLASVIGTLRGRLPFEPPDFGRIVFCALLYIGSHVFRITRLALLVGNARLSLRRLATLHLYTAAVSLGAPWRSGDAYRAVELGRTLHRVPVGPTLEAPPPLSYGLTFVWLERLFDAALLMPMLLVLLLWRSGRTPASIVADTTAVTVLTFVFVAASVLIVALLPENLRRVGTYLIRRHEAPWTVPVLRRIHYVRGAMQRIPALLAGRTASLAAMSLMIWLLESLSLSTVLADFDRPSSAVEGLLGILSQSAGGNTLPHLLTAASNGAFYYLLATQVPLAVVGSLAGLYYTRSRRVKAV